METVLLLICGHVWLTNEREQLCHQKCDGAGKYAGKSALLSRVIISFFRSG